MNKKLLVSFLIFIFGFFCLASQSAADVTWISTSPLPSAYVGVPYSHQLQATSSFSGPITYSISAGSLPGLSLSVDGLITGTVTSTGTAVVTIDALDGVVSAPASRTFSISYLNSGITGPLRINRLQLQFDNNRPEITVTKNASPPEVSAIITYTGSGLLKGYWTVDGNLHSQINRSLSSNANLTLPLPSQPPLPIYQTGSHRVGLVITEPNIGVIPDITYFVKQDELQALEPIRIISPADRLIIDDTTVSFDWYLQANASAYLIEFREVKNSEVLFSAYTRKTSYTLPAHSMKQFFSQNKTYAWQIKGISEDDNIVNKSKTYRFTFK